MKDKPTIVGSGTDHHVSLSNDKRVAARSHLDKRTKARPADRIATAADFEDIASSRGSLQASEQLEDRIRLLARVTADLQKELLAVQSSKEKVGSVDGASDEIATLDQQMNDLNHESKELECELEALRAHAASTRKVADGASTPLRPKFNAKPHPALKKNESMPIQSLSDSEQFEVDLEQRMQRIRQTTQSIRVELEELVQSAASGS